MQSRWRDPHVPNGAPLAEIPMIQTMQREIANLTARIEQLERAETELAAARETIARLEARLQSLSFVGTFRGCAITIAAIANLEPVAIAAVARNIRERLGIG